MRNSVVYFGKTEDCCEAELFHLDYQLELIQNQDYRDDLDIVFSPVEEKLLYEFRVQADNILVITSKPSCDAINISLGAYRNEWFEINDKYGIPSSSQILGTILKKKGFNGIMYASVRQQTSQNLVLFEENSGELDFEVISKRRHNFVRQ